MDPAEHHADFDAVCRISRYGMGAELFDISDGERMAAALAVRFVVFVDEQHVPAEEEIDEHDRTDTDARHALIRDGGKAVAAGRYYRLEGTTAQVGRMAVLRDYRGRRIGRQLLDALVDDACARGLARVALNAQDHAVAFYAKAGFTPFGETLVECDILHQPMELRL
jgi:predicted GNAT family N-acyltransferase